MVFKMLTENPYVSEIYLFGSRATQSSDDLSDIDLTTTTLYPVDTEAHIRQRLSDEFGVTAIYTIIYDKHEIARSFCLTGVSPFCKIDIGFSLPDKTSFFQIQSVSFKIIIYTRQVKSVFKNGSKHPLSMIILT